MDRNRARRFGKIDEVLSPCALMLHNIVLRRIIAVFIEPSTLLARATSTAYAPNIKIGDVPYRQEIAFPRHGGVCDVS